MIRDRLEFLASVFAIDVLTYTVLSNHLHLVLRSRPDVAASRKEIPGLRRSDQRSFAFVLQRFFLDHTASSSARTATQDC